MPRRRANPTLGFEFGIPDVQTICHGGPTSHWCLGLGLSNFFAASLHPARPPSHRWLFSNPLPASFASHRHCQPSAWSNRGLRRLGPWRPQWQRSYPNCCRQKWIHQPDSTATATLRYQTLVAVSCFARSATPTHARLDHQGMQTHAAHFSLLSAAVMLLNFVATTLL